MRSLLLNAAIVIATLLFLAILGEVGVRMLQRYDYLAVYGKPLIKQRTENNNAKKSYNVKYVKSDNPKLFVEYDTTDRRVNKFGMRGPVPALAKASNTFRIAVLGDSVAFGYGLSDLDSFPRQLERLLNEKDTNEGASPPRKYEIINFAVSGYGLEAYPEVYKIKVRPFKPDMVILAYVLNDPYPTKAVFKAIEENFSRDAKLKRVGRVSQLAAWLLDTSQQVVDNHKSKEVFNAKYSSKKSQQMIDENLALLRSETESDDVSLVTFVFPYFYDMSNYPLEDVHAIVGASLQRVGIPYHDLLNDYRSHDGLALRLEPSDYTHPNAEGQRIAAEAIERYLKQHKSP